MYRLILVDDEEEVRKGVLKKIDWAKYGYEVVGEAENGRQAIEIAEKVLPDVVITDIKMPFMDGMELSKQLNDRFPTTKVIILTGFDEFEYAQKAIKCNVIEYVLKPISSKELIEVLVRTKDKLDKEIEDKKNFESLRENYLQSLPLLKEKFLTSLITSTMKKKEIEERSKNNNIDLNGDYFVVSTVSVDYFSADIGFSEKELYSFAVMNMINEIMSKYNSSMVFLYIDRVVIISVFKSISLDSATKMTLRALEEIRQNIGKFIKLDVTIGAGTFISDITLIKNSFENSLSALDYRMILGNNKIIWIEDVEPKSIDKITFDEIKEHQLSSCLKVGNENDVHETIDTLFSSLAKSKTSIKEYQIYLMEIVTTILKVAKTSNINIADIFGENYNLFIELYKLSDLNEVKSWLQHICVKIMESISQERQDTCKVIVSSAKEYINKHYSLSDLGINDVCTYLHISPTYFSALFKKETKTTFINYLTQVRMEAAKDLLKSTSLKSFEIAEKVGYSEPNYFSYSFKKNFGISPSEFRSNN